MEKNEVPKHCITLCLSADDSHKILILVWVFTTLYSVNSHLVQMARFLFISSMSLESLGFIFLVNLLQVIVMLCYADIRLNFTNQGNPHASLFVLLCKNLTCKKREQFISLE